MFQDSTIISQKLDNNLAPYAVKNCTGKFRLRKELSDKLRTRFQVDRDRVLHSKMFRRLKNKTQVYTPYTGDHYRDRLTHTLEVSQLARSLARSLALNEDLAETIALAHDLGHTPFGHAGETALNECMQPFNLRFEHNSQSLQLVQSLNLNLETLEGLMKHSTPYDQNTSKFIGSTLEAQIVNYADEIAYHNHDLDDGIRSKCITLTQCQKLTIFQQIKFTKSTNRQSLISQLIKLMLNDLIDTTSQNIQKYKIKSLQDVYDLKLSRQDAPSLVMFSDKLYPAILELRQFLYKNFYHHPSVVTQSKQGQKIIKDLFQYYLKNPQEISTETTNASSRIKSPSWTFKEPPVILIKDYISGMTDNFARIKHKKYALS